MRVVTQVLKTILTKFKGKLAAMNIKKQLQYIKKILVKDIIVLTPKIEKESEWRTPSIY